MLKRFCIAVPLVEVATQATETARRILRLREEHRQLIIAGVRGATNGLRLLDVLFERPVLTIGAAQDVLQVSYPTAAALISQLEGLGLLAEITGGQRNRLFVYRLYLDLFEPQPALEPRTMIEQADVRTLPEAE